MKIVILAGGLGSRLGDLTENIPKPMVTIGNKPILWHIMECFAEYGHTDFIVALGYKGEVIKKFFLDYSLMNSNFSVNTGNGEIKKFQSKSVDWNITLVDTGLHTMTGGRVKKIKPYIDSDEPFILTYGDGLSNVNINDLVNYHKSHGKLVTLTAVHPPARFGELEIENGRVKHFEEKPQMQSGWINGGFFVMNPGFIDYIEGFETMLEREPVEKLIHNEELMAFCHSDFWQCMDTKRDRDSLESMYKKGAPWKKRGL